MNEAYQHNLKLNEKLYRLVSSLKRAAFIEPDAPFIVDVTIEEFGNIIAVPGLLELLDAAYAERMETLKKWHNAKITVGKDHRSPFWKEEINYEGQMIPKVFFIHEKDGKYMASFMDAGRLSNVVLTDYSKYGADAFYIDSAYALIVLVNVGVVIPYNFDLDRLLTKHKAKMMYTPEAEAFGKRRMS